VTNLLSGRTWFGYNNWATERSLFQTVPSGCHAMPRLQCVMEGLFSGELSVGSWS